MGRLEGKVAFLTGAGAGIAKATALAYVREGAKVAIIELNKEAGTTAEKDVRAAGGDATLHVYEDEGHGFRQRANQLDEFERIGTFLDRVLGGRGR